MLPRSPPRRPIAGPFALILLAVSVTPAATADVTVDSAAIAGGKLVITGTTATANTRLRLDGRAAAAFNAISDGRKKFKFRVAYLPSDCIVTLDMLTTRLTVAASDDVVVANCARGLSPRGDWVKATDYSANDLVTHDGSSWVARGDNISSPPGGGGDWQLFAATGAASSDAAGTDAAAKRVPPTGPAGGDLAGAYPDPIVKNGAIITSRIAAAAVTNSKLANGVINENKLANNAVTRAKIADLAVGRSQIGFNAVTSIHVLDERLGGGLGREDLAANSVGASEIATNAVGSSEIADFSLSSQDIGVLFAEVNGDGTLAHSSGGVTSTITLPGNYTVDFGRAISSCTAVATLGQSGSGTPPEGVVGVSDRQGNAEAVHVRIMDTAHSSQNFPFRLVVVC